MSSSRAMQRLCGLMRKAVQAPYWSGQGRMVN